LGHGKTIRLEMKKVRGFYSKLTRTRWELGFIRGGLERVFKDEPLDIDWIKNPFTDRWFADPFILDVNDEFILILAEEYQFSTKKGRIAKLFVNRQSLVIERFEILLETPTHLSFPSILRKDGKTYVYPESASSGKLNLYLYDSSKESLIYTQTICDDMVWDSVITDRFGEDLLFTANKNDYFLDIYKWSSDVSRFIPYITIESPKKNSRMAGQFFDYRGETYCPRQDCERAYGGATDICRVIRDDDGFHFPIIKKLRSPHKTRKEAMHTFNVYKGIVVIDVKGYDHPIVGRILHKSVRKVKKLLHVKR